MKNLVLRLSVIALMFSLFSGFSQSEGSDAIVDDGLEMAGTFAAFGSCWIDDTPIGPHCWRFWNYCDEPRCIKFKVTYTDGSSHTQIVLVGANGSYDHCNYSKQVSSAYVTYATCPA